MKQSLGVLLVASVLLSPAALAQNRQLTAAPQAEPGQTGVRIVPVGPASVTPFAVSELDVTTAVAPVPASAAVPAAAPSAAPLAPVAARPVGDVTRALLAAQATGQLHGQPVAGQALPALGATATHSWQRYVDSFAHPMPEWFEEKVAQKNGN